MMRKLMMSAAFALCVFCLTMTGCKSSDGGGSVTPTDPTVVAATNFESEKLQVRDMIRVTISGIPKAPEPYEVSIRDDGKILLPMIGLVDVAGKTVTEVQDVLTEKYAKYYKEGFVVTVMSDTKFFFVTGEVRHPGKLVYTPGMTFLRAISAAGGYSTFASKSRIQVTTTDKKTRTVSGKRIERDPNKDFRIMPGDIINVPKR